MNPELPLSNRCGALTVLLVIGFLLTVSAPALADDPPEPVAPSWGDYTIESARRAVPIGETFRLQITIPDPTGIRLPVVEIDPPNAPRRTLELHQLDAATYVAEALIDARGTYDVYVEDRLQHSVEGTQLKGVFGTRSPMFLIAGAILGVGIIIWLEVGRRRIRRRSGQPNPGVANPRAQDSWWWG